MELTAKEIQVILDSLRNQYGVGYNHDPMIAKLQAKLSIELELARRKECQ